jgi:hypothetical protein
MRKPAPVNLGKDVFSTGESASICQVSQQTIIRCFDNGSLKGFRVPGSKFRRIPRESLIVFMQSNGIPLPPDFSKAEKLIVLTENDELFSVLADRFKDSEVTQVRSLFELGYCLCEGVRLIVDYDSSKNYLVQIAEGYGRVEKNQTVFLYAPDGIDKEHQSLLPESFRLLTEAD